MSVVIIGGNERMERIYADTCLAHGCKKAKVYTKVGGEVRKKLGAADLYILFTNTVSHKMAQTAVDEAKRAGACVERCHSSSLCALRAILRSYGLKAPCDSD